MRFLDRSASFYATSGLVFIMTAPGPAYADAQMSQSVHRPSHGRAQEISLASGQFVQIPPKSKEASQRDSQVVECQSMRPEAECEVSELERHCSHLPTIATISSLPNLLSLEGLNVPYLSCIESVKTVPI